jgi:amidophosphoribosyltransferase
MCGILGIVGTTDVAAALYDGLTVLQHRGQDAAGIATVSGQRVNLHKGNGLVSDVFGPKQMQLLQGKVGIGHCRYPTAGSSGSDEAQPFYTNAPFGIALAHNGNLTNTVALRQEVFEQDHRHINTQSDSEVLLNVLAHELLEQGSISPQAALLAVEGVHRRARGGYSVVAVIIGLGLLAFRDPHGIRPLVIGKRESPLGNEYAIASESAALDILGFTRLRDVAPGEAVVVTEQGRLITHNAAPNQKHTPCIFEFVYFARPDSMMDDISVHKARMRMGVKLGEKILRLRPDHDIDTIIPVPDTSRDAALEMANVLGVKYREGFIKNRYIGRTFIMPGQSQRVKSVKRKLNPMPLEFKDRVVLLVDDSIVRGTTSQQIVQMARDAGARKVYLASAAPPVRYPNVYGIDMPAASELVAHGRTEDEIQKVLGCDWLIYQDIADLEEAVSGPKHKISHFDSSCFTGEYITGIETGYFEKLELDRSDAAKISQA